MLKKEDVFNRLKAEKPVLQEYGINDIGVFGSCLNETYTENSDIDLLLDFQEENENFDNYIAVCELLENLFKDQKIDIVTKNGLSAHFSQEILEKVEYA